MQEIERLQDNNAKLVSDYNLLKAEYERLIEERQTAQDFEEKAKKALDDSQEQIASLKEQLKKANEQIESLKNQQSADDEIPLPEEAPAEQEKPITAEDDLFFDVEEEEVIKPEKKKKNRHEHHHVNPYQQKAKDKEQKGYTQQRQYSFFELDE